MGMRRSGMHWGGSVGIRRVYSDNTEYTSIYVVIPREYSGVETWVCGHIVLRVTASPARFVDFEVRRRKKGERGEALRVQWAIRLAPFI